MMTGQILGGSTPIVAIKYQIAIMLAIFSSMSLSSTLAVVFSIYTSFDSFGNLKGNLFSKNNSK
jgi:putative ABC transport system permease protein